MLTIIKDSEAKLLQTATTLRDNAEGYYVIHFHLSNLQERYKSDFQIKIAVNIINDLSRSQEGVIFVCHDNDIFVLYQGENHALIEKVIFQLRYLFIDDPLAYTQDETENEDFCSVYMLEFQWRDFFIACKRKIGETARTEITAEQQIKKLKPITPSRLAQLEPDLFNMDLSQMLRTQRICATVPGKDMRPLFQEFYVHIPHLRQALKTDVDLTSNALLFHYLTEILDYRILHILRTHPGPYFKMPISLNLNVSSLFSEDFSLFDASLNQNLKSSVIIEIHIADVFSDINAFMTARKHVQRLGYRVCLDGLNNVSFPQVDRESLGFDLAKLQWNADLEDAIYNTENRKLTSAIQKCGSNRIILCRCDTPHAVSYGQALGISLFQGRYIDKILDPLAKVVN